jgi:hypothetical protein
MASFIKNMTQVGGGSRQIARLLQAKAPPNHMLAYITPEEAEVLKSRGGSGLPDPETGIPSFQQFSDPYEAFPNVSGGDAFTPVEFDPTAFAEFSGADMAPMIEGFEPPPFEPAQAFPVAEMPSAMTAPPAAIPAEARELAAQPVARPAAAPAAQPAAGGDDFLKRLALAGVTGLFGARQARAAQKQAGAAAEEQRALGRPYQEQGRQLQAAAQRGELSPVAQQSLQALRARLAQGAQARGGVGAAQAMQQMEAFRQQLLQQQFDFGLRLAQIGDQYAAGAIKTGLQADQYVNNLTNQFFTNVARTLFSQPAQTQQPAQPPAQQPRPPGGP